MNQVKLVQFIKQQGWSMFGIVSFEKVRKNLEKHEKVFDQWIEKGFEADMDYLNKMKGDRFNPVNKLPDVKSVVVLGAIYSNGGAGCRANSGASCGLIARYARGKDYHRVLKKKLIELSDWLKQSTISNQQSAIKTYISVDSGPTVDRVLAESAGLGFFGKNSCIIDPSKGSFFFIASVFTNLKLEETAVKQMPNCGDCQKCANNCPTGALVSPGVIDARRCISYLTIENKGDIPEELRSKVGNRIFGCDACQEVCPFNVARAHKQEITIEKLKSDYGVGECLDLREILSIKTDAGFLEKFAGTPIMRAKRRGLIRNACVVAGNSGDKSLISVLEGLIRREKDVMLASHAKWAIDKLSNL